MSEETELTLSVSIHIAAPPQKVWDIMTKQQADYWCPKPWTVEIIEQDMRPGGRSAMIMRGPDGEELPTEGVYLEIVPGSYFMTTDAFTAGWQPATPFMVGIWAIMACGPSTPITKKRRAFHLSYRRRGCSAA